MLNELKRIEKENSFEITKRAIEKKTPTRAFQTRDVKIAKGKFFNEV